MLHKPWRPDEMRKKYTHHLVDSTQYPTPNSRRNSHMREASMIAGGQE
jgi:hypothetical protein